MQAKIHKKSIVAKELADSSATMYLILERSATHRAMSAWASRTSSATMTSEVTEAVSEREDDVSSESIVPCLDMVVGRV